MRPGGEHASPAIPCTPTAVGRHFPAPSQRWKRRTGKTSGTCVCGAATSSWATSMTRSTQRRGWTARAGYTQTTWASWMSTTSSISWGITMVRNVSQGTRTEGLSGAVLTAAGKPLDVPSQRQMLFILATDLITLSSGEVINPSPIEERVMIRIPIVRYAMLVGQNAPYLCALLTLKVPGGSHGARL